MAEFNQMDEWIVDDLVESIHENHTIWRETFERDENVNSLPRSGVTGQVFKTNLEGFARLQRQYDFTDPRWMTRAELMSLGWDITDDARGVVVGRDNYDKDIVVFNVSQAQPQRGFENSIKPWNPEIKEKQWFNVARADFILNASGANIKYGFKNSQYNTVSDNICLPYQSNFRSADDYYWTAFHELMHWTGSNSRLARNTSGNKNSPLYAREELVAELGAYMMCLRTGVSFDKSNASAYIKGWAENMQLDSASLKKELTLAWSEARRACDFVSRNVLMNMKKNNMKLDNSGRVYLNVDKDDVKDVISLGARYDTRQYAFYITPEDTFAKFNKYLSEEHRVSDVSVSLVTKTEYERDEDRAEEIRRDLEAEANAPPEVPALNMTSNLARYITYSAIKSEPQLRAWYDDDLASIISEIHDTDDYIDSSHFVHDVADNVKKQIVASIAKYSKNSTEADIYEQWDRDVNAYIRDGHSVFVQMDSAIFSLKNSLKNSFEDDENHIRMLDEAYHDDAFLALINPKVENTVTEEAEQVAEVSENSESVQKNEAEQTEFSITDFIQKYDEQFQKVIDFVENNTAYLNAVRNNDQAYANLEFTKAFKESETLVLMENPHQNAEFHNDLYGNNDRYAEVEDYLFKQSYQKLIDRNQAKHLNNDEKTTIARYIAYKEVRNTSFGHELIQDGSLGKVLSDVEWKENDNISVLAAKVAISTKKHAIEGMSRAWNMTLEDTHSAVSKVSSGGFDPHKLAIERMNEGVNQIITNITHSYGMADFDQLLNEARNDVRFNEQLSANLEPVQNENAEFVQKNENDEAEQNSTEISDALAELISQNPDVVASPDELLERHFQEGYQKLGFYQNIDFETFKKINDVLPKENDESASESFAKWEHQDEEWCRADVINYISKNNDVLNFVLEKGQMPPLVFMHWSESNNVGQAFDETDRAGGFLPFAEADRVITEEDEAYAKENRGYEKTKLSLLFLNKSDTGEIEDLSYGRFRYDCGDLDGGIVKHIESWCDWCEEHKYGEWESLRDYKNQCLPILGKLNEQFEEFRLNQSQEQEQSNELNWKIQWWRGEETDWNLELVCDGKVISSASVSEDVSEKRLHRLINNFSEELLDYFDLPEEQLEDLTKEVENRVNGFMMSIKNVVELGHENQETAQTTLENDANKNYTDNRDTSIYEESKENLDHEISAGMGGESRDSSSRTADEGLGTNAGSSQSSEISEGIDNRTEGRAGTLGTDDGRSGRSGVLSDDAQTVSGGISSGREQSGLRGRGSDLGEGADASTYQSHEGEQTGELSDSFSAEPLVSRTSGISGEVSPEHQGVERQADRGQEGRDRVGDSGSSERDQGGIESVTRGTGSETSEESANGIENEADGRSSGRLRQHSDRDGESDRSTGSLAQGENRLGERELSSGERVSSSLGRPVQVEVSAGAVRSGGDLQENEARNEMVEGVLQSGVQRGMGDSETVVLGDDQGISGQVFEELGSRDQRAGSSGENGDSERAEMESSVRSESDPQSTVNQSELSERAGGRGQSEGLDNSLSARSGASGEDFGRTESQGRSESGISSGSRRKRSERDGQGEYDLDFGELSNHVIEPEEAVSNDTVIDISDVLGNKAETNTVSSENSVPAVPATRYHITDLDIGAGGDKTRLSNNMEALRTLKLLEKENRNATLEEQEKLAKYVGWGGLSNVFNPSRHEYEDARKELKTLLTNREYNDARASTVTAFYTPPEVIQSIYRGLEKAGFKGGRILEPSCGVGNFFGMLPESMSNSELHGVELDSVSAKIAQKLYPDAHIEHDRFENFDHKGYFDVVVGNVPFASLNISDPESRYDGNLIHNYFVGKAVEQVREGGIVALVTSTGTLDSEKAVDFRNELAKDADLLGAFRLPEGVFSRNAGTSVSSDILFLQKRNNRLEVLDEKSDRWANESTSIGYRYRTKDGDMKWIEDNTRITRDKNNQAHINAVFLADGSLRGVCGNLVKETDRFGKNVFAVKIPREENENSWQEMLKEEVEDQIQDSIYQDIAPEQKAEFFKTDETESKEDVVFVNSTNDHIGVGSMGVDGNGDVLYRKDPNRFRKIKLDKDSKEIAVDWIKMKDQLNLVKKIQISGDGIEKLSDEQATLRSLYENFAEKHGRLNGVFVEKKKGRKDKEDQEDEISNENPKIRDLVGKDKDYYSVRFIEQFDEKYNFTGLSKICYERVLGNVGVRAKAETESDALAVSMNSKGRVDLDYMSEILGNKDKNEIVKNLEGEIFLLPNVDEEIYQTKEEYLSGDVVKKLEEAQYAVNSGDTRFENNVNALIGVQPAKRDYTEIGVSLGSHWVPVEHVQNFVNSITGGIQRYTINYDKDASAFNVRLRSGRKDDAIGDERQFEYKNGKATKYFGEILEATLNSKFIQVKGSKNADSDNAITIMQANEANIELTQIQKSLSERYREWLDLPEQQAVREDIEAVYNRKFNSVVPREYDGSHLSFDGMNPTIKLKPHQKAAVAHTLYGGSTLIAHEVGAGKTFELIASAMEAKRLGLAQKTMILVPNAVLGQWGQDIYKLYPDCKALVPTMEELKADNRPDFIAKLAHNDFDIVVMPQSTFDNNIRVSKERQTSFIDRQIEELSEALTKQVEASDDRGVRGKSPTIKNIELRIKKYRDMLNKINDDNQKRAKETKLEFEELGCDRLYVDEAHQYKNAPLWTSLQARNLGSATGDPSDKAMNMMMATEYINDITDERGVVFATGTPLTNSISEVYAMQTYIAPSKLKEKEINCLDDFISAFAVIDKEYELKPAQTEYVQEERLRSFNNLKELKTMFREFTDIALTEDLGLKLPKANYEVITADISPNQQELMKQLSDRITNMPTDPKIDNMLKVTSDGRKVGLDPRLYDPSLPDEAGTKLNLVADKVAHIYHTSAPTDTQLIFSDLGVPGKGKVFDVYTELKNKLVERGVPEDQIADVYSCGKKDKDRNALFSKVNEGKIRILMGSTEKLGTGVNVQKNLLAVHHVDVKWKPSDLTQRNGRIIRQGNVHDSVNIYNYVTDKTFDAYQYQTLLMKQKFIRQFMSANDSVANSMTDLDDQTLSINEALACCAGDPNITKKAKLEGEIMFLAKEKSNFEKRKAQAKNRINSNERSIEVRENEKAQIESYQSLAQANPAGSPITINGKAFTDRKLAGEELARMAISIEKNQTGRIVKVAEYRGLDIGIQITHNNAGVLERNFHVIHKSNLGINFLKRMSEAKDLSSNMNFIDDIIDKQIPHELGFLNDKIKELHQENEGYKPVLGMTWNKQDSLTSLHDELMEVYSSLSVEPPLNIRKIFDANGLASNFEKSEIIDAGVHDYGLPEDPEKNARMEKLWDELQSVLSDRHEMSMPDKKERAYFDVPYEQRQEAKALGCKWDKNSKKWFISEATPERIEAMEKAGFKTVEVEQENLESVQKNENAETKQKTLLSVPFEEKDLAKELGAKFDRETKSWYVPEGMDLEPFERWKPTLQHEKMWIKAPFEMHEQIKELGAKYDATAKCWFVPENVDLKPFENLKQDLELNKVQSERTDTPIAFFVEKMREAGLVIDKYPEINGRSTRVVVQGDKAGQKSGWYKIHTDGVPVCLFQNWRTGDGTQKLVAPSTKIDMSIDLEKVKVNTEAMAAKLSSQEEATKQLHAEVAKNVQERLAVYKESERTEYIQNKDIPVFKGVYATNRGATVVPLSDIEGNVKTMQTILPTGTKMFEKGGELKGSMHVINADNLAEAKGGIVICEGYATGATIREATNGHFGVVCAMTSHNLLDVAKAVSEKYPDKPLIIAGDNDRFNVNGNVGRLTAEAVAKELGAKVVIPEFKDNDRGSDFNDLKKSEGLDKVKEVFRQVLQKKQEAKQEEKVEKKKSRGR
ncbi:DUF5710 domain-containing protein [Ruminobacter sp. RM87]|uniref:DUF5710 domain-containing protein n=1 Tax=Ruminobacter sp. RM87 TaxID=1200567 RepID=UPI0004E27501|nr:DUF5710 domain-containing protein [Ruminobacter sp. RM87]